MSYLTVPVMLVMQGWGWNLCGVQGHADCCWDPPAPTHLWGAGVWPRGEGHSLLAAGLHAPLLCLTCLCCSLCVGLPAWSLSRGQSGIISVIRMLFFSNSLFRLDIGEYSILVYILILPLHPFTLFFLSLFVSVGDLVLSQYSSVYLHCPATR